MSVVTVMISTTTGPVSTVVPSSYRVVAVVALVMSNVPMKLIMARTTENNRNVLHFVTMVTVSVRT